MGNNSAGCAFARFTVEAYNLNVLTVGLVEVFADELYPQDIDFGDAYDYRTNDGKGFEQVIVELFEPEFDLEKARAEYGPSYDDEPLSDEEVYYEAYQAVEERWRNL